MRAPRSALLGLWLPLAAVGVTLRRVEEVRLEAGERLCNCSLQPALCGLAEEGPLAYVCKTRGGCKVTLFRPEPERRPLFVQREFRCVPEPLWKPPERPIVCETARLNGFYEEIGCCRDGDFCAQHLNLTLLPQPPAERPVWLLPVTLGAAALLLLALASLCCLLAHRRPKLLRHFVALSKDSHGPDPAAKAALLDGASSREVRRLNSLLRDAVTSVEDPTSGSGSGLPLLVQRTVARQIELKHKVGEGRFGCVWAADWKGEHCAVKIFESRDEKSWFREVEIYQTNMLRHPNLLAFFASDNKDATTHTQLWLITELHAHGSLYDFLRLTPLTLTAATRLARSLANGLAFLHAENVGTHSKPAIAHRDLKSKNVLVKADGECCVADLGMAVRYSAGVLDMPDNGKVGTRRYLAPELLDDSIKLGEFESFRRADVYSLGLTLWEICRRTEVDGAAESYELPYHEWVEADPSAEEMRAVVCGPARRRPSVPNRWHGHKAMAGLAKILRECWAENPSARLPALRVKKTIDSLTAAHLPPAPMPKGL